MANNALITVEQARQITGGRTPNVPIEYETAIKALVACREIDDAKVWSDKADALATWAKIFHETKIAREARMLKLHAYRRMAELAKEIKAKKGTAPAKILMEQGLTGWQANEVMAVGRVSRSQFDEAVARVVPPAPSYFKRSAVAFNGSVGNAMRALHYFTQRIDATEMAQQVPPGDRKYYERMVESISDWLDEFEQHLK